MFVNKSKRQFRLRTLMTVVSLVCVAFAMVAARLERQRRHRVAIEKLNAIGADVYSQEDDVIVSFFRPEPSCGTMDPPLHYYYEATGTLADFRKEELKYLGDVEGLNCVNFMNAPVGDEVVEYVVGLRQLDSLAFDGTSVSDEGVVRLAVMRELRTLSLSNTSVSNEGIAQLVPLQQLYALNLRDTPVSDSGIAPLAKLPRLRWLGIRNTNVSEELQAELDEMHPLLQIW